mmetsp:Transcript_21456/g.67079  ORF Transcript_21456/g.67079 Transcript_21456/m.67079 type:complete len:220 (-) Transcript_21456:1409-2068(-)
MMWRRASRPSGRRRGRCRPPWMRCAGTRLLLLAPGHPRGLQPPPGPRLQQQVWTHQIPTSFHAWPTLRSSMHATCASWSSSSSVAGAVRPLLHPQLARGAPACANARLLRTRDRLLRDVQNWTSCSRMCDRARVLTLHAYKLRASASANDHDQRPIAVLAPREGRRRVPSSSRLGMKRACVPKRRGWRLCGGSHSTRSTTSPSRPSPCPSPPSSRASSR